jgi:hypothetical protein
MIFCESGRASLQCGLDGSKYVRSIQRFRDAPDLV